jgi:hypothetical protein
MKRRKYIAPKIIIIGLDKEISLALESTPPWGPEESKSNAPEYFNNTDINAHLA